MGERASGHGSEVEPDEVRLYGRESECAAIDRLIEGARRSQSGVLVLRAEAGIGKSALLGYALSRGADMRILRAVGVEPEIELPFAALHQLLRPAFSYIDRIPDVQAEALRSALAISLGDTDNRFVIALAVLSLLAELATDGPVLCLIDDAHWLDQSSADTLAFVARRLEAEGIVMLFAAREGEGRSFPASGLAEREVKGLDPAASERLLVDRFGEGLAPEIRHIIVESSQGVPLALLEIPASLTVGQLSGRELLPRPVPMGHQLEEIMLQKVRRLSMDAQTLLVIAAAEGSADSHVVLSAAGVLGIRPSALPEAEASGLIRTEGTVLVFRHPILRSAIYREASLPQREAAHRVLVEVLVRESDADRRVWHRAALVSHPDNDIADELEATAERARRRGGHAAASGALRRAAELTSSDERQARRLVAAARAAWDAGLPDDAITLLRTVETEADVNTFAERRHVWGEIELRCGVPLEGARLLIEGAERIRRVDPHKALQMLLDAAQAAYFAGELAMMTEAGRRASTLAVSESEPEASLVDVLVGVASMVEGKGARPRIPLREALDRLSQTTEPRWLTWAGVAATLIGDKAGDDAFRGRAEAVARRSMAVGDLAIALARTAWADLMNYGRVISASNHAEEGLRLAVESGMTNAACFHSALLAWVAAVRGEEEECVRLADRASDTAMRHGLAVDYTTANWAVGLLRLSLGQWDAAAARLETVWSAPPGTAHPYLAIRALPDLVEAAVRAGHVGLAESAAAHFADHARDTGPEPVAALTARCRALITNAPEAREKLLMQALVFHDRAPRPFDRARTLLLLGEHLRRERRRTEARSHLRSAMETLQSLGASPWVERARAELRATGEKARRREPNTLTQLTPQQVQIVRLVAEGATNKEVAAQLFLSPRTVDYHLRNVFVKLGISSRAQLMRLPLEESSNQIG